MSHHPFWRGVGLGALAGAAIAVGLSMTPKDRNAVKRSARRAARAGEHAVEDVTDSIGI